MGIFVWWWNNSKFPDLMRRRYMIAGHNLWIGYRFIHFVTSETAWQYVLVLLLCVVCTLFYVKRSIHPSFLVLECWLTNQTPSYVLQASNKFSLLVTISCQPLLWYPSCVACWSSLLLQFFTKLPMVALSISPASVSRVFLWWCRWGAIRGHGLSIFIFLFNACRPVVVSQLAIMSLYGFSTLNIVSQK